VHHHQLEPSRSVGIAECDRTIVSWGIFVNLLEYKLDREGKVLVEPERWFPSSKTCSVCLNVVNRLPWDAQSFLCKSCGTMHDRDSNRATNIRAEGIRQLSVLGTRIAAKVTEVRQRSGRKPTTVATPLKLGAQTP
ncbi:MAG: transposase, partial [Symploca sp. SIO2E6]|nr:transposase [Symploca sp. SIO2E6]